MREMFLSDVMNYGVTPSTERNEVFLHVIAEQAARENVMDLESTGRTTMLATPSVPLQNCSMERTV
jgi:hypothetical protein